MKEIILYTAFLNIIGYIVFTWIKFKKIKSISDSDYLHSNWLRGWFETSLIHSGIALALVGFYPGLLFIFTAIFSNFKRSTFERYGHMISAFGGFILSAFWFLYIDMLSWFLVMLVVNVITYIVVRKMFQKIAIIEVVNILFLFAGIVLYIL